MRTVKHNEYTATLRKCGLWVVTSDNGNAWHFISKERVREIFKGLEIF